MPSISSDLDVVSVRGLDVDGARADLGADVDADDDASGCCCANGFDVDAAVDIKGCWLLARLGLCGGEEDGDGVEAGEVAISAIVKSK